MFYSAHANGRSSRTICATTTALTIALAVLTTTTVGAQGGNAAATNKKALVGSWLDTVTFPAESGRPPLKSLVSYHDDQIMTYSDQGTVTTEPPTVFSSGRGVWKHVEKRTFGYTAFGLISDLSGNLRGYLKTRGVYTLSQSGDEYHGTTFAEVLDIERNVLFSVEVTNAGQRIQFELP